MKKSGKSAAFSKQGQSVKSHNAPVRSTHTSAARHHGRATSQNASSHRIAGDADDNDDDHDDDKGDVKVYEHGGSGARDRKGDTLASTSSTTDAKQEIETAEEGGIHNVASEAKTDSTAPLWRILGGIKEMITNDPPLVGMAITAAGAALLLHRSEVNTRPTHPRDITGKVNTMSPELSAFPMVTTALAPILGYRNVDASLIDQIFDACKLIARLHIVTEDPAFRDSDDARMARDADMQLTDMLHELYHKAATDIAFASKSASLHLQGERLMELMSMMKGNISDRAYHTL